MSRGIFITGTGTDVGKTYISALIVKKLHEQGINVGYFKGAMSGNTRDENGKLIPGDAVFIRNFSGIAQPLTEMCPYIYETAVSPHLASQIEGNPVDLSYVSSTYKYVCDKYDFVVFEGSGGIVCPIRYENEKKIFLIDIIKLSKLPCIIVSDTALGSINRLVLTYEYIKSHNIPTMGIIFNNYDDKNIMEEDNIKMCKILTGLPVLAKIKHGDKDIDMSEKSGWKGNNMVCSTWFPYTQMKTAKSPIKITYAEGVHLYTEDNHKLIDAISSWWCVIHGYNHPEINEAIKKQIDKFSHVMLGGLTHDPIEKLSQKLAEWLPGDLNYCFFSDSGSVAVEVALKMALQFNTNRNLLRNKILALEHAYHGDTFKAMEVGDDEDYHFAFSNQKSNIIHIPTTISVLENAFQKFGNELSCFIVEPLLQCAGGMRMYDISFLQKARELCNKYDVLLLFDEIATGFGRTGNRFVSDLVQPDILMLGKALTGGYIGHAVTVTNKKVWNGFYSDNPEHALMHGPTFMGNALACCAALKSIELFEKNDYISKIKEIEENFNREMSGFTHSDIKEIRIMGGCLCIEVFEKSVLNGFQSFAYDNGIFIRPFLNYMYTMPPYIIEENELIKIIDTMKAWFCNK